MARTNPNWVDPGFKAPAALVLPNTTYKLGPQTFYVVPPIGILPPEQALKGKLYGII